MSRRDAAEQHLQRWLDILDAPLGSNGRDLFNLRGKKVLSVDAVDEPRRIERLDGALEEMAAAPCEVAVPGSKTCFVPSVAETDRCWPCRARRALVDENS